MVTSIGATANRSKELKKAASCRRGNSARGPFRTRLEASLASLNPRFLSVRPAQYRLPLHHFKQRLSIP